MKPLNLNFKRGEFVRVVLARFARVLQRIRVLPGTGVRLSTTPLGTIVSFDGAGATYRGHFAPTLSGTQIQLAKGLINGKEPWIDEVPISGDDENPQPALTLDPEVVDPETQESWIVIEVGTNDEGQMTDETRREAVHVGELHERDSWKGEEIGIIPITQIIWQNDHPLSAFPVVHHNQVYYRTRPAEGEGQPRHFFGAA